MAFDPSANPAEVAARYAMSRVIARARDQVGTSARVPAFLQHLFPAEAVPDTGSATYKACYRLVAGDRSVALSDLLAWCHAFSVPIGDVLGGGLADPAIYPPQFRGSLEVPDSGPPRFRSRRIDWPATAAAVVSAVSDDASRMDIGFVNSAATLPHLVRALIDGGLDRAVVRPAGIDGFDLLLGRRTAVVIRVCCTNDDDPWEQLITSVVSPTADILIAVTGASARARANSAIPGLFEAEAGTGYEVPFSAFEDRPRSDASFGDRVSWTIEAVVAREEVSAHVLVRKSSHDRDG